MLENKLDDFSAAGLSSAMAGFSGAGVPDALAAEPGAEIDLLAAWGLLVGNFAHWTTFATLTFESKKYPDGASSDQARWCWRSLVRYLNHDLFGNHYAEIVHHSYFAYALAFENHKSGLLHCHALMSRRINYSAVHRFWQGEKRPFHIGLVDIKPINKEPKAITYITKYISKSQNVPLLYKPEKEKEPAFKPFWFAPYDYETN